MRLTVGTMKILILNGPNLNLQGRRDHRSLRYADLRNLLRTAPVALSRRRIRLLPVQYRRRVDRTPYSRPTAFTTVWCSTPGDIPIPRWRCATRCRRCRFPSSRCISRRSSRARSSRHVSRWPRGQRLDHGIRAGFLPVGSRSAAAWRRKVESRFRLHAVCIGAGAGCRFRGFRSVSCRSGRGRGASAAQAAAGFLGEGESGRTGITETAQGCRGICRSHNNVQIISIIRLCTE